MIQRSRKTEAPRESLLGAGLLVLWAYRPYVLGAMADKSYDNNVTIDGVKLSTPHTRPGGVMSGTAPSIP
ncbi:hypothetical protein MCP1_630006 [Candidatus Terasakiella magnetica]|nr:hypothetical protein MCP1_630006 [Candidatus Terasakiella magnetica]